MKMLKRTVAMFLAGVSLSLSLYAQADEWPELLGVQQQWAVVNYSLQDKEKLKGFDALIAQAQGLTQTWPDRAEAWIWLGISQSSAAGAQGGLDALGLAKQARESFEKAMSLDETALSGSAMTSLGVLYHKLPGWPISFGSDKKAEKLLKQALTLNPEGIDPNYFYAEFLFDDGKYAKAREYLLLAKQAQPRPNREFADSSRQKEIDLLLAKVEKKLTR
ncbi:tetratricopeptide repeat protein [Bowmanella denitrificans]|uniref:tetratricopeptide repeat protein n=1 Tax=Bowmanella denitrificans TaxID=366582 RepID=UPI000C9A4174|nr:tetratricopeptide repeat protein [Bowmanella denitrificans]